MDAAAFRHLVDEVKSRTDIVELIGRDIELRPAGAHLVGSSPWNRDSTPSFVVWPGSQQWVDYSGGGNGGGDCINYVQRRGSLDFMEALRELAVRAGVVVPNGSSGDAAEAARALIERRRIEDLHTVAATYYHHGLPSKIRREWLQGRYGFDDETIDRLLLGWANGHLLEHLKDTTGVSTKEALATGLFVHLGNGRLVDLFCNRIVFPYWRQGRVCYFFIARRTEHTGDEAWEQAKYKKLLTRSDKHPYVSEHVRNGVQPGLTRRRGDQPRRGAAAPAGPQALRSWAAERLRAGRRRKGRCLSRHAHEEWATKKRPRTSMVWCTLGSIQPGSPRSFAVIDAGSARRSGSPSRHCGRSRAPRRGLAGDREGFLGPAGKAAPWPDRARSDRRLATLLTKGKPAHVGLVSNRSSAFTA